MVYHLVQRLSIYTVQTKSKHAEQKKNVFMTESSDHMRLENVHYWLNYPFKL